MPQIQRDGQLVEVSQEEYNALNQPGQATTPAEGSYEQYAAAQAKAQAVEKLAAADGSVVGDTNISPEYQRDLGAIRSSADAAAGTNKDAYAARYAQEEQNLYTNAPTSRAALEQELSAPPPTVSPGSVPVQKQYQQGTDGQVIGTLNTTNNIPDSTSGSIVSSPVRGLTAGGITSSSAPAPSYPSEDPQIPPPSTEGVGAFTPPPAPDAAFAQAQVAKEERWQQAAATNPEGINDRGSVVIDKGGGVRETINRDGSYEISSGEGTFRFDAAGQQTSYTTPTINGLSQTYTTDGVVVETYSAGPLRTETISYNGDLVSTNTTVQIGDTTLQQIQVGEGPPVNAATITVRGEGTAGYQITEAQVGDGEIVTSTLDLEQRRSDLLAADEARTAAADQLREDIRASQAQVESGIPLGPTQLAAIEEQARELEAAEAEVLQAEEALAEADPTIVAADTDPQVAAPADQDPIPSFDTTEFAPAAVTQDPEVEQIVSAEQAAEFVPVADVDTGPAEVSQDPEVEQIVSAEQAAEFVPVADIGQAPEPPPADSTVTELTEAEARAAFDAAEAQAIEVPEPGIGEPLAELAQSQETQFDVPVNDIDIQPASTDAIESGYPEELPEVVPASSLETSPELLDAFESGYPEELPEVVPASSLETSPELLDAFESGYPDAAAEPDPFEVGFPEDVNTDIDPFAGFPERALEDDPTIIRDETGEISNLRRNPETGELYEPLPPEVDPNAGFPDSLPDNVDVFESGYPDPNAEFDPNAGFPNAAPENVSVFESGYPEPEEEIPDRYGAISDDEINAGVREAAARDKAQLQQTIASQRKAVNNGDWRVRLRLAPGADYLYAASDPGPLLQPLKITDGIIFPYTPQIDTQYKANYNTYDLTHSNYRGYFYQNSYVDAVNLKCTFTAQSTSEANYLLAVIHFFRSVTKMFYGQDAQRGSPPPLVYLTGLGQYQFNEHSCVVSAFNYSLPTDVDYIRAQSPNINNTNLSQRRAKQSNIGGGILGPLLGGALNRLANAGAPKGGITAPPPPPNLGLNNPTYVPTKMDISITLLPIQSRSQVSKQFGLKQFANGDLLKGGFW